ncbi:MAG: hypothetical protein M1608_13530, partial [Candidatus Omnitrophica bacterium]|nr:hypothetical protein [Candidatus Omnitrophota bacterium]
MNAKIPFLVFWGFWTVLTSGAVLPSFDFTTPDGVQGWQPANDISSLEPGAGGLAVRISGDDPYMMGPARDYPLGANLWLHLRLKSDQTGTCQVFYFRDAPTEPNSVRFDVPGGKWFDAQVPVPALGTGWRLRIDPPGNGGTCVLARLWVTERIALQPPSWPKPEPPHADADALSLTSGALKLIHNRDGLGSFVVEVAGRRMAAGNSKSLVGYVRDRQVRWFALSDHQTKSATVQLVNGNLTATVQCKDPDGAQWEIEQVFTPAREGSINVQTRVTVDQDRAVICLPAFTLLPGLGSFGTNKNQAVFAGVEYLGNEPSSSEADLAGPPAKRQAPDTATPPSP